MGSRLKTSIRARASFFVAVFTLMLITLGAIAIIGLLAIDRQAEAINDKWLVGTRILGELSDQIAEFRIAEGYRALATDHASTAGAEAVGREHRAVIDSLQKEYLALLGGDHAPGDMGSIRTALENYFASHDAWVTADVDGTIDEPARDDSQLHQLYEAADVAVDHLIEANKAEAQAATDLADWIVDGTIFAVLVFLAATVALGGWLVAAARREVTRPLEAITDALSKLAAGDRDIRVPELNRDDEIGVLAKAFDSFRGSMELLEQAHEETRKAQDEAQLLARHDPLTGLPNRRVFFADLRAAVERSKQGGVAYSILLIDLDRFKAVNDLQGHPMGDLLLCEVAQRMRDVTRKSDTVARLGGDEFAIISEAEPHDNVTSAIRLANRVLTAVREPIAIGESVFDIDASIGISACPADGLDAEGLLRAADIAMYRVKKEGRGKFHFFEQAMDEELRAQTAFEADLRKAVADEQIEPYYQPLVDMRSDRVWGFEILARWHDTAYGWVPPDRFIPVAERLGLIPALTSSLLRRACRDAAGWDEDVHLSLNIAPIQFKDPLLPNQLLTILRQEGFAPSRLEVEMTESALVGDVATAKEIMEELQSNGIKVSLDDFGTGYSSLYHLREFKFDKVKIDRSFIKSVQENSESEKIVAAILSLARSLGLPTVAEGIEERPISQYLAAQGCEYGQGYYFGKAMTATDVTRTLGHKPVLAA